MFFKEILVYSILFLVLVNDVMCQEEGENPEGDAAENPDQNAENGEATVNPLNTRILINVPCKDGFGKLNGSCTPEW